MHPGPVRCAQQMALLWEPRQNINHRQVGKYGNTDTQLNLVQLYLCNWGFPGGTVVKNMPANAGDTGDMGLKPGSGRSPGGGNGNPLQYSCLENSMDREAWRGHNKLYATEYAHIFIVTKKFWTQNITCARPYITREFPTLGSYRATAWSQLSSLEIFSPDSQRGVTSPTGCILPQLPMSPNPNQPSHCLQSTPEPFFPEH